MPVYVYKNLATGQTFEVQQRITESAWTAHPETGEPVKRLVQPVGIAFKGSGFYVTDSRSTRSDGAARKSGGDGASASDGGSASGGESKGGESKDSDAKKTTSSDTTKASSASTGSSGGASD